MARITQQDIVNAQTNAKIEILDNKLNVFMEEMRSKDNQRAEDMREIRTLIDGSNKYVRNLTFTAIGAIAAMVITVLLK